MSKPEEVKVKQELAYKDDIEHIYTNYTQFFISDNDIVLHLGFKENLPDKQVTTISHRVIMSHNHAKQILKSLSRLLEYYDEKKPTK